MTDYHRPFPPPSSIIDAACELRREAQHLDREYPDDYTRWLLPKALEILRLAEYVLLEGLPPVSVEHILELPNRQKWPWAHRNDPYDLAQAMYLLRWPASTQWRIQHVR